MYSFSNDTSLKIAFCIFFACASNVLAIIKKKYLYQKKKYLYQKGQGKHVDGVGESENTQIYLISLTCFSFPNTDRHAGMGKQK